MNNPNVVNMTGRTYGRLTVLERSDNDKRGNAMWLCKCECGNVKAILGGSLRQGSTRSCGCMLSELSKRRMTELLTKHGFSGKKLYSVYRAMRERCEKQTCKSYGNYGGRGISVCDEWKNDRALFFEWALKNGYQEGLQIDSSITVRYIHSRNGQVYQDCRMELYMKGTRRGKHLLRY